MSKYFVKRYNDLDRYHVCIDQDDGSEHRLDLMVHGDFAGSGVTPEELVGKMISCEGTRLYMSIAMGVKIEEGS